MISSKPWRAAAFLFAALSVIACAENAAPDRAATPAPGPAPADRAGLERWAQALALRKVETPGSTPVFTVPTANGRSVCGVLRRPDGQTVVYQVVVSSAALLMAPGAYGKSARDRELIDQFNAIVEGNCRDLGVEIPPRD